MTGQPDLRKRSRVVLCLDVASSASAGHDGCRELVGGKWDGMRCEGGGGFFFSCSFFAEIQGSEGGGKGCSLGVLDL